MTLQPGIPSSHFAIPVHDINIARCFYGEVLGFAVERSDTKWSHWNVGGHQVVTHQVDRSQPPERSGVARINPFHGHDGPEPRFGLVLPVDHFIRLADKLKGVHTEFMVQPHLRFRGELGEQWTMFFRDPSGNALEFKAFNNPAQLFAA